MRSRTNIVGALGVLAILGACSSEPAPQETVMADSEELQASDGSGASEAATPESDTPADASEATQSASAAPAEATPATIDGITNKRLSFSAGANSANVEGSITGYETIDYLLNVRAGQPMNISMATQHTATYFNLLEPGETEVAVFNGSMDENQFEGIARKSGDYRIRIYMMRSAARRNEKADYRLEAIVSP